MNKASINNSFEKIRILYVDDEQGNLNAFKAHLRTDRRLEIHTCLSGEEGLSILESMEIHIVVSDQKMPHMTGMVFLEIAKSKYPAIIPIIVTAHRDLTILEEAKNRREIFDFHDKPWDMEYMEQLIYKAYEEYRSKKSN